MKTWEMIKELTENPKKKFIRKGDPLKIAVDLLGYLRWKSGHDYINLKDEWEEAKQPVRWQEAIEAWVNNKGGFRIEYKGKVYTQFKSTRLGCLHEGGSYLDGIIGPMFELGKWYIED